MMNSRLLLFATSSLGLFWVNSASAETLQEAIGQALRYHPSVVAANAGYEAAEHEANEEWSGYFPEISASGTAGRIYQDNATSRGLVTTRGAAWSGYGEGSLTMRQMLFDGMETPNRVAAADARASSLEMGSNDVRERIALRTAQAYIDVLRTRQAMRLITEQKKKNAEYQRRIKIMFDEGVADEAELQQARDVGMIIDGALADYEGQLSAANAAFLEVSGHLPDKMELPDSLAAVIPEDVDDAIAEARNLHPGLLAARLEADAAEREIKVARAAYFPEVAGELSYLKSDKKDVVGGENEDRRAVVRMNWNFSTGGKQVEGVERKKMLRKEAQARADEMEREVVRDVYQAFARYLAAVKKDRISRDRIVLNEKLFSANEKQFEGSRVSLLQLMRSESQLFNARREAVDNHFDMLKAQYEVLAGMGFLKSALEAVQIVKAEDSAERLNKISTAAGQEASSAQEEM